MRKLWKILAVLLGVLIVVLIANVAASLNARRATEDARAALVSGDGVVVEEGEWITLRPEGKLPATGLILFPGAYVEAAAYAPIARLIAARGFLVVLVKPPFSIALLDEEAPAEVMAAYPEVARWAVGGHSLGGVSAAHFAFVHPNAADALVLWAAGPSRLDDLSGRDLPVLGIYGSRDGVYPLELVPILRDLVPPDAQLVELNGGNHAQFGSYGDGTQGGDLLPSISRAEQERQVADLTAGFLELLPP